MTQKITIIGGGLVGASLAEMLFAHHEKALAGQDGVEAVPDISVTIIDPSEKVGYGIPYRATAQADDLNHVATNNQPNNRMSHLAHAASAFSNHIAPENPSSADNGFAKRVQVGKFAHEVFNERLNAERGKLEHKRAYVTDISPSSAGTGTFKITTQSGETLDSDIVIVADGHQHSNSMPELLGHDRYFHRYDNLDTARDLLAGQEGNVVIRGTSQSMVDWLRLIDHVGFQGDIYAVSRSGHMPWKFDPLEHPLSADDIPYALTHLNIENAITATSPADLEKLLETELHHASKAGLGRAHVYSMAIRELAPLVQKENDPVAEASGIKPFFNTLVALYGNPTPPQSKALIDSLRDAGRLKIVKGDLSARTISVAKNGELDINGGSSLSGLKVKALFDGAIYARSALDHSGNAVSPLLSGLHRQGALKVCPDTAQIFSAGVQKVKDLFLANGPSTNLYKWGIESFRGKNNDIAREIIENIWDRSLD